MTPVGSADVDSNRRQARGSSLDALRRLPRSLPSSASGAALAVATLTTVGLLLRLSSFGDSLYGDEVGSYYVITGHSFGRLIHLLSGHSLELTPPVYFVLAWVSERLFGDSAQSLKLVSLLAGTATIPLTYTLGRWTVGGALA